MSRRLSWAIVLCAAVCRMAAADDLISIGGAITTRVDGLPVPGAVVTAVGSEVAAMSDASGRYTLQAPPSTVRADRLQLKVDGLGLPPRPTT